jgi:hypothetical protein
LIICTYLIMSESVYLVICFLVSCIPFSVDHFPPWLAIFYFFKLFLSYYCCAGEYCDIYKSAYNIS